MDTFYLMKNLDESERVIFQFEYGKQKKNAGIAYVLLIFLGLFGIHKLYLENKIMCVVYTLITILGAFIIIGPFITVMLCIIDLFLIPSRIETLNNTLEKSLYDKIINSRAKSQVEEKPATYYEPSITYPRQY
ncbi:MAG: hypothetical protein A2Y25_09385 [Candidatus Melainabacteria bacterium GWF2_37_15]|nr:MAG: hypothetical protein A2Y25_09385 [Candidatus Melainabacteria bacterium GWF2_37_15]